MGRTCRTPEDLQAIRELLLEGKHTEADQMFVDKFSRKALFRSHQTMGDLWLDFKQENITDYRRELDIERAISKTIYKSNDIWLARRYLYQHLTR